MTRTTKLLAAYVLLLGVFASALFGIAAAGRRLEARSARAAVAAVAKEERSPLALLLLEAVVIIAATRACARAAKAAGQPAVIGEVIGGILLGPSALGALWPHAQALLFPPAALSTLHFLSEIGLIVFMFIVGMEVDLEYLRERAPEAALISNGSVMIPFLMGCLAALGLYADWAPPGAAFLPFCLFLGISMSITAFPVLARILRESGLDRKSLGTLALACAAVDDVTAWCGLAAVSAIAQGRTASGPAAAVLLCAGYAAAMLLVVRPLLSRWLAGRAPGPSATAAALLVVLSSACATEAMGIHALFGAFMAGLVMPREAAFREVMAGRLEDFCTVVLLPLFFALTGLRTEIGLLSGGAAWAVCAALIAVAVVGKFGAGTALSRLAGLPWREAAAVGALMNTRGLVELVALNVGYDLGIITPSLFTMLVLMALTTTLMTGPMLSLFLPSPSRPEPRTRQAARAP